MEITEVKVFPVKEEKLKAFVSVVLDDCFMINDIKIIKGRDGRFISMPSRRKKNGEFKDVAHPLNNETRKMMEERILAEYDTVLGGPEAGEGKRPSKPREEAPVERSVSRQDRQPESAAEPKEEEEENGDRSLDEVAEAHLSDSFWTT
jgi:stage V sporulation protein G